jgi:hypothetical protein
MCRRPSAVQLESTAAATPPPPQEDLPVRRRGCRHARLAGRDPTLSVVTNLHHDPRMDVESSSGDGQPRLASVLRPAQTWAVAHRDAIDPLT